MKDNLHILACQRNFAPGENIPSDCLLWDFLPLPKPSQAIRGLTSDSACFGNSLILRSTDLTTGAKVTKQNRTSHLAQHPAIPAPMCTTSPSPAPS